MSYSIEANLNNLDSPNPLFVKTLEQGKNYFILYLRMYSPS